MFSWTRRRDSRGAAAIEGAILGAAVLVPMLLLILRFGGQFWQEQRVTLYPPRLSQTVASGTCTVQQIADRATQAAAQSLLSANSQTLASLGITTPSQITNLLTTTVTSLGTVGASVTVTLNLPNTGPLSNISIVRDVTTQLNSVSVSTASSNGTGCYP